MTVPAVLRRAIVRGENGLQAEVELACDRYHVTERVLRVVGCVRQLPFLWSADWVVQDGSLRDQASIDGYARALLASVERTARA